MLLESSHSLKFEKIVAKLLINLGKKNVKLNSRIKMANGSFEEIDITFGEEPKYTIAGLKAYRYSSPPPPKVFDRALISTVRTKKRVSANWGILIISCPLTPALKELATSYEDKIETWDANRLLEKALTFPDIYREFEELFEISGSHFRNRNYIPEMLLTGITRIANKGEQLAKTLKAITPGRDSSAEFEQACINSLKYIFSSDLHGWHEQNTTEDDLHRRDLICRILPNSEVWRLVLTDLRSRYVIFEFKNYTDPITPHEINTTERYLFPAALRTVAILISPKGCSASAEKVISGAMRDQGKLILSLTVPEIEKLLTSKDKGEDPNTYLFDRIDDFLMRLGR